MRFMPLIIIILALLSGCSHMISSESRALLSPDISFRQLRERPEAFAGKYVLLGGTIAGVRNSTKGGEIEVVRQGLDWRGRPDESEPSDGRFIARSAGFLDPLVYGKGMHISMVGQVLGGEARVLDGIDYTYPVISVKEVRIQKPGRDASYPMFHFGIGIGHSF
jgi:outer membrane lipoprotein